MKIDTKDVWAGLIFAAFGTFFSVNALTNFETGTATRVGPAVFPMILGGVLVVLGVVIMLLSLGRGSSPFGAVSWRGLVFTMLAVISFGVTVEAFGFVPSIALSVLLSAYGSSRMTLPVAISLTAGMTLFCFLIFKLGLGLPLEPLGSLFQ